MYEVRLMENPLWAWRKPAHSPSVIPFLSALASILTFLLEGRFWGRPPLKSVLPFIQCSPTLPGDAVLVKHHKLNPHFQHSQSSRSRLS